ncbi:hypothetical protein [Streptomyces sp. GC420]|nr:hypothetical protein [Streptomyces sp. GC420]
MRGRRTAPGPARRRAGCRVSPVVGEVTGIVGSATGVDTAWAANRVAGL